MTQIPLTYYLILSAFLLCSGLLIVLIKKNAVFVLIGIELMLNAANLNLVAFSKFDPDLNGQVFAIFSVVIAAAEAAIALAILLNIYKTYDSSDLDDLNTLEN
ncbi:NADH-quinone oxidoreductase subunit NuoK [Marinoscillum sp. 108]|jgi:NADH:ubiquinone oxidoreductase subunit K|uniref:NADH-quinone oxidoreductase subunit K n=1 Tax=Marinoscillum luteum TaxID=861051 RepID=A0ABW7NEN2_9BACT|nr:NADH-quinone oxidoreductase subunit NuoK [Marinoscillum sp. 108]VXD14744.1 F(420)H(2) dehydrogenase subunit K [Marinoscillum sp. 108]